jgi:hypothetical protein
LPAGASRRGGWLGFSFPLIPHPGQRVRRRSVRPAGVPVGVAGWNATTGPERLLLRLLVRRRRWWLVVGVAWHAVGS